MDLGAGFLHGENTVLHSIGSKISKKYVGVGSRPHTTMCPCSQITASHQVMAAGCMLEEEDKHTHTCSIILLNDKCLEPSLCAEMLLNVRA